MRVKVRLISRSKIPCKASHAMLLQFLILPFSNLNYAFLFLSFYFTSSLTHSLTQSLPNLPTLSLTHSITHSLSLLTHRSQPAGVSCSSTDSSHQGVHEGLSDTRQSSPPSPGNVTVPPGPTPTPTHTPGPTPNTVFDPYFYHPSSRSMRSFSSGSSRDRGDSTPASVCTPHTFGEGTCFPGSKSELHNSVTRDILLTSPLCGSLRDLPFDRIVDLAYMFNYNDDERYHTHSTTLHYTALHSWQPTQPSLSLAILVFNKQYRPYHKPTFHSPPLPLLPTLPIPCLSSSIFLISHTLIHTFRPIPSPSFSSTLPSFPFVVSSRLLFNRRVVAQLDDSEWSAPFSLDSVGVNQVTTVLVPYLILSYSVALTHDNSYIIISSLLTSFRPFFLPFVLSLLLFFFSTLLCLIIQSVSFWSSHMHSHSLFRCLLPIAFLLYTMLPYYSRIHLIAKP